MHRVKLRRSHAWPAFRTLCSKGTQAVAAPEAASTSWTAAQRAAEHAAFAGSLTEAFQFGKAYLLANPLRTNAVISGTLCATGDVLAQAIERRLDVNSDNFNAPRMCRMAVYGTLICGPILHLWYTALATVGEALSVSYVPLVGSRLGQMLPWVGSLQKEAAGVISPGQLLVAKVAADGLLFQAPFLNLYFLTMGLLEGRPLREIFEKAKAAFHRAWGLSLLVWTPVQVDKKPTPTHAWVHDHQADVMSAVAR